MGASRRVEMDRSRNGLMGTGVLFAAATMMVLVLPAVDCTTATLSNVELPLDQFGNKILTGEANVMEHNGSWFFYFNNWGTCPGVDCCASSGKHCNLQNKKKNKKKICII